jgi:flagellar hook-associated protein 1 FlgK
MSFAAISNTVYTSLTTSQVKMQVASSNIANADTAGYTQKIATQVSLVSGTIGAGVEVSAITSAVDKYLLKDLAASITTLGTATTTDSYANSLQSLFGSTTGTSDSGTSLANTLASLQTALASLASTPESDTLKALAVDGLDAAATQMREISSGIQTLRGNADDSIETAVNTVNDNLDTIAGLNTEVTLAAARGQSTADLEDQRNVALQAIAGQMDVSYYVNSDNEMRISTASGTPLLDSRVHELSYSSAALATAATVFSAITVGGKDITGEIGSGNIGALIDQRDTVLPAVQDELDELAKGLITTLNAVYNTGTALPAPQTLTGTKPVAATDALAGTGTVRIALTETSGALVSYADFDLASYASVSDFTDAINATTGLSAGIDANGHLTIGSTDGSGVSITDIDSVIGTRGVSDYFGLNDLLTGVSAANIAVRADLLATPGKLAVSTLSKAATLTAGSSAISTSSTLATSLSALFANSQSFGAAGTFTASNTNFADYAASIVADAATNASKATTTLTNKQTAYQTLADAMSSQTGVNIDEETARINELQQQYSTAAQLLSVLNAMFDALLAAAKTA